VSLGFDDGLADQAGAVTALANHGMKGTFYIISGRVGASGNLTASQIQQIQAAGNEIGGHTITHPDLPTLSTSQQQHEICDGRTALQDMGFTVNNLAYPFGDFNSTTEILPRTADTLVRVP